MEIQTDLLQPSGIYSPSGSHLSPLNNHQTYCGLDCCLTLEIFETLSTQFPQPPQIYSFERALQAPYLEIMQRGFLVDELGRRQAAEGLRLRIQQLSALLNELSLAAAGHLLNPNSPKQLQDLFFNSMKLPEVWLSQKGVRRLSTNREALEKLDAYLYARPFVSTILRIRDLTKQLQVFEQEIDPDHRFRTSYNIAGTETGRPSSSTNAFGTGGNAQNISPTLRYVFTSDPGWKLCVIDLEQVEARDVGFFVGCLFGDWKFLDNCESGDLHTNNSKLVWPGLPWTGDPKADRALADRNFYRDFSYRDMSKRGGHLSNYYGTAWTMSRSLKIPLPVAEEFQARYVRGDQKRGIEPAFPAIAQWWQWTAQQLQTTHQLLTPFGRRRHFFGRPGDDTTLREGIAFLPQSTTADRMNLGLWRVWKKMSQVQLLAQTYDSITFQFREDAEESQIVQQALELIRVELRAPSGRKYVVPGEAKVGWNWGAFVSPEEARAARLAGKFLRANPGGLVKWKPGADTRKRAYGIDRVMQD